VETSVLSTSTLRCRALRCRASRNGQPNLVHVEGLVTKSAGADLEFASTTGWTDVEALTMMTGTSGYMDCIILQQRETILARHHHVKQDQIHAGLARTCCASAAFLARDTLCDRENTARSDSRGPTSSSTIKRCFMVLFLALRFFRQCDVHCCASGAGVDVDVSIVVGHVRCAIGSPRPMPPPFPVQKGEKTFSFNSGGMPPPLSWTETSTPPAPFAAADCVRISMLASLRFLVASMALAMIWAKHSARARSSPGSREGLPRIRSGDSCHLG